MPVKIDADKPTPSSHLFTLRLWREDLGGGQTDWRGKIQHVRSGEARYFRDWQTLETFVEELLMIEWKRTHVNGIDKTGR